MKQEVSENGKGPGNGFSQTWSGEKEKNLIKEIPAQQDNHICARESAAYASEISGWWNSIEQRVEQTANVIKNTPEDSHEDTLNMLLELTKIDPDSQDIYIAYGDEGVFLDGSGWVPDDNFVFTDRPWYQGALNNKGAIYSSDPCVDASTGKTCLACSIMLRDNVVLSSDINFDKVAEKVNDFDSISPDAKYYIINKNSKDMYNGYNKCNIQSDQPAFA